MLNVVLYDVSVTKETGVGYTCIPTTRLGNGEPAADYALVLISSIISKFIDKSTFPSNMKTKVKSTTVVKSPEGTSSVKRSAQATE